MSNDLQEIKKKLSDKASSLIIYWTKKQVGDMSSWFGSAQTLSAYVEKLSKGNISGIDKGICVTETVVKTAQEVWIKYTDKLSEEEIEDLKNNGFLNVVSLIIDNPSIIQGSTSLLKKLLDAMDKNKDGVVTKEEIDQSTKCCSCFSGFFLKFLCCKGNEKQIVYKETNQSDSVKTDDIAVKVDN